VIKISGVLSKAHSQLFRPVILVVTSYFLIDRRGIEGPIGEHYVGLYGTFVKNYSKLYKVFWYSTDDSTLHIFNENGNVANSAKMPMPIAILKALAEARKSRESVPSFTAIIAYYYAAKNRPVSYFISLSFFHLLKMLGLVNVIVDIVDPPVEVHITYSESPSPRKVFWGTLLDIVTLKRGTFMWFCSTSYQKYLTKRYDISLDRTHVIYDGSVPELITPKPPKAKGPLTVFYSGSMLNIKGIPQLIESINELRKKGVEITLMLTGGRLRVRSRPWIKSFWFNDWFEWIRALCEEADICVVPYPKRLHWDLTHHIKLPDYMAAGKPIVAMYGRETASLLEKHKCGLTATNWDEFQEHIIRLYKDRELAKTLGENGRKAVEEFFNYTNLSEMLHKVIQGHLKVAH